MEFIGKYHVVHFLGEGGMAEVWLCRRLGMGGFDKPVVIKRIRPTHAADPEFVRMFLDEARVAASLNHPNVVQVYDIDTHEGTPFIAMEYLQGPSLASVLKRIRANATTPSIPHVLRVVLDISAALVHAHSAVDSAGVSLGLVHRDVSPHNILVSSDGVAKLLDFGIAKSSGRLSETQSGTLKGKLAYMAPEQAHNNTTVDHRADVFSLGVCLYEATTGKLPFAAENDIQRLLRLLAGEFTPPSEVVPNYPPELEKLVLWAMETDPDERCPSAQALHDALEAFIDQAGMRCNHAAVAKWLTEIFPPDQAGLLTSVGAQGLTPTSQPSRRMALSALHAPPPPPAPAVTTNHLLPPVLESVDHNVSLVDDDDVLTGRVDVSEWDAPAASATGQARPHGAERTRPGEGFKHNRRAQLATAAVAVIGAAVVITLVATGLHTATPTPANAGVDAHGAPVRSPALNAQRDSQLRDYLIEARRMISDRRFAMANDLLAKAREEGTRDESLILEMTKISNIIECELAVQDARQSLSVGDYAQATTAARLALSRDPSNQDATRILAAVKEATAKTTVAERPREAPSRSQKNNDRKNSRPKTTGFHSESLVPTNPDALLPPTNDD